MDVMTIKYSSSKTKDVAEKAIGLHCNTIRSKQSFDLSLLRKLCGTVIYSGLFLLPDYKLCDGVSYSIEAMCFYAPPFLAQTLHEILEQMGSCITENANIDKHLLAILKDSMFPEVMSLITKQPTEVYYSLFISYCYLTQNMSVLDKIQSVYSKGCNVTDLWEIFMKEVIRAYPTVTE